METGNRALGRHGEDQAARFLSNKGFKIIGRNVRTFVGEIDVVAEKESLIVFAEVKTRRSLFFGPPYLSITQKKRRKLIECALCYLKMTNRFYRQWRIDVLSLEIGKYSGRVMEIEHFVDAIEGTEY